MIYLPYEYSLMIQRYISIHSSINNHKFDNHINIIIVSAGILFFFF